MSQGEPTKKPISKLYSLQFLIAVACIIVSIIPMTYTGISVYSKYSEQLTSNSNIYTDQIMDQLKINIEEYLKNGIKLNNDIAAIIEEAGSELNADALNRLSIYYSSRNELVSISIADRNGEITQTVPSLVVKSDYDMKAEQWYDNLVNGKILYGISEPHIQNIYKGKHEWVITIARMIPLDVGKGILLTDIRVGVLDELVQTLNLGGSGYVYLVNSNGDIIYHPQQALVFAGYKEETAHLKTDGFNEPSFTEELLTFRKSIDFADWQIIGVTYIRDIYAGNTRIAREILAAVPLILAIIIMLSWYVSGQISQPIKNLEEAMHKVEGGNMDAKFELDYGEKEVVELGRSFNAMVQRISDLIEENRQEHEAKRISELSALQAQINPHFLYNTLDSIMWMAESGQNDEVVAMVTALARLFRISISKGRNIISVKEEIEHATNYLSIQKVRYKDKFDYTFDVDEQLLDCRTPKLILQPIIENAIYHGIEYMVDQGHIEIRVKAVKGELIYEIEDNGLGMDQETINTLLFKKEIEIQSHIGSGVGVRNVDERIKIRYGEGFGIFIRSEIEVGTVVSIRIPLLGGDGDA